MALSDYLDRASLTRWEWGKHDCCQFVRRWVEEATGRDPAERLRYSSEMGAALLAHRAGGMVALIEQLAANAGLTKTESPLAGDIGIIIAVTASHGEQPVGAIHTGWGWAFLTKGGLGRATTKAVAAWRVLD